MTIGEIMRKSNWLILGVLVVASILFLGLWYLLGFDHIDAPFDLVLSIVWWVIVVAICIAIHVVERRRQRAIRTAFVAPGMIYNSEIGIMKLKDDDQYIPVLAKMLSDLDYGFEKNNVSNDTRIRFKYVVHTDKFSDNGRVWEGDVIQVTNPQDPKKFKNKAELSKLLEGKVAA